MNERELKYYIISKANRSKIWVVLREFESITMADKRSYLDLDTKFTNEFELPISEGPGSINQKSLQYVYAVHIDSESMIVIVQDGKGFYYLIKNDKIEKKETEHYNSIETIIPLIYKKYKEFDNKNILEQNINNNSEIKWINILTMYREKQILGNDVYTKKEILEISNKLGLSHKKTRKLNKTSLIEWIECSLEKLKEKEENTCKKENEEIDENDKFEIISRVTRSNDLWSILKHLTQTDRKHLGIPKITKIALTSLETKKVSNNIIPSDFAEILDIEKRTQLWKKYVLSSVKTLDLTGLYHLTPEILTKTPNNDQITEILMSQNINIDQFEWFKVFKHIQGVSIWSCIQIDDNIFDRLCKQLPYTITSLGMNH